MGETPTTQVEEAHAVRQDAGRVLDQPTAGELGPGFDRPPRLLQGLDRGQVGAMRRSDASPSGWPSSGVLACRSRLEPPGARGRSH